jgi:peptidyl-prolyl cis-trans isomerase B (cyclophilin B)
VTGRRQERQADRRRQERQAQRRAERAAARRKRQSVFAAVVAGVVVLGAVLLLSLQGEDDVSTQAADPTPPENAEATDPPPPEQPCPEPASGGAGDSGTFEQPPLTLEDGVDYTATLSTNCGDVVIDLLEDAAPVTVNSFRFLAGEDFFAETSCHRLVTEGLFVLQCGDPTGTGTGGPGYEFGIENAPADGVYPAGTVAMARTADPESNGSQFFIVYEDTTLPTDGGGYSVFGEVTDGLDVVEQVAAGGNADDGVAPAQPVVIESVTVTEQGA